LSDRQDVHFLIDSATPTEVSYALMCMENTTPRSSQDIAEAIRATWGYTVQKQFSHSLRRIYDLGLASRSRSGSSHSYMLTELGGKLASLLATSRDIYNEVMHFLHYDAYRGRPEDRKLFWSYRICTDLLWTTGCLLPTAEIVSRTQQGIRQHWPELFAERAGGNFNKGGVSAWKCWLSELEPSPISDGSAVVPRQTPYYELALLALAYVYRARGLSYGDPVVLDGPVIGEICGVFFLEEACCRELLERAARLERCVPLRSTFAGPSVTLSEPYTVERL